MSRASPLNNRLTALLGCRHPVLLGPMRRITGGDLAAAVSASGGCGQIAASGLSGERLRSEIDRAQQHTEHPFAVNIPLYRPNAVEALEIAIERGVRIVTTGAGDPSAAVARAHQAGVTVLHKVSSVAMARKAEAAGVDAVIATGYEAGGHLGRSDSTTLVLVPQLVDVLGIPVIAAGGVVDARGLVAALALGAEGVELGTRFLATPEAAVKDPLKDAILAAGDASTQVLGKASMPLRVLRNEGAAAIADTDPGSEDRKLQELGDRTYLGGKDNRAALIPCGQAAGLIGSLVAAGQVVPQLIADARRLLDQLAGKRKEVTP